jgi:hypothetical protein
LREADPELALLGRVDASVISVIANGAVVPEAVDAEEAGIEGLEGRLVVGLEVVDREGKRGGGGVNKTEEESSLSIIKDAGESKESEDWPSAVLLAEAVTVTVVLLIGTA